MSYQPILARPWYSLRHCACRRYLGLAHCTLGPACIRVVRADHAGSLIGHNIMVGEVEGAGAGLRPHDAVRGVECVLGLGVSQYACR